MAWFSFLYLWHRPRPNFSTDFVYALAVIDLISRAIRVTAAAVLMLFVETTPADRAILMLEVVTTPREEVLHQDELFPIHRPSSGVGVRVFFFSQPSI